MNGQSNDPSGGTVPMHRFQELQEQLRKSDQAIAQLRGTLDQVMIRTQNPQAPAPKKEPIFKPEVEQALDEKFNEAIEKQTSKFKQAVGYLTEENDHLKFVQKFGYETMNKYQDKISQARDEANRMGKYVTREEAYQKIFFEETNKKPVEKPEAPKGPQYDPYLKTWVDTNPPVAAAAPQVPPVNPQVPAEPKAPEAPTLPPMGPVNAPTQAAATPVPGSIGLDTDAKSIDAWETKYGNQTL